MLFSMQEKQVYNSEGLKNANAQNFTKENQIPQFIKTKIYRKRAASALFAFRIIICCALFKASALMRPAGVDSRISSSIRRRRKASVLEFFQPFRILLIMIL